MRHAVVIIGLCGAVIMGSAYSAEPASQSVNAKRQMIDCMSKRMHSNKWISFNDAKRVCRDKLQSPPEALAAISPTDSGVKAH
jgi:hypothetical protein